MKVWRVSERASNHLNLTRGLAAVAVAAGHVRGLFFVGYEHTHAQTVVIKSMYFLTGLGHEAVMVFFVLSGFFVSATILKAGPSHWSIRSYAIDRLSRLYIVLVPALMIGALCDGITARLPGAAMYFYKALPSFGAIPFSVDFTSTSFAGNLAFLQTSYVGTFGSNGALWSLANEFWYYTLWPLLFVLLWDPRFRNRCVGGVLALGPLLWTSPEIWKYFPIWLLGCAIHALPRSKALERVKFRVPALAVGFAALGSALVAVRKGTMGFWGDPLIGLWFAIFLYIVLHCEGGKTKLYGRGAGLIAGFSFSLYAVHFPILVLIRTLLSGTGMWQPGFEQICIASLILCFVLATTYLFSLGTEAQTGRLRALIRYRTARRSERAFSVDIPATSGN